jgi:hypothetical protein
VTTRQVVQRVLPLIERIASRTIDKARLLQYLSARASVDWGLLTPAGEQTEDGERLLLFRDRLSGEVRRIRYPACLPAGLEEAVLDEYKRLALATPLSAMDERLFAYFYRAQACDCCRYDQPAAAQVCRECHFAGRPVNFEPR